MTELKIGIDWKNRLIRWSRYAIIVFCTLSTTMAFNYIPYEYHNYRIWIGSFQIAIGVFTVLSEEYWEFTMKHLDDELSRLKKDK